MFAHTSRVAQLVHLEHAYQIVPRLLRSYHVLHPVNRKGKQGSGEMELKTDADGRTSVDGIPYGPLRVQVLVPHFQTFGEDYEINKAQIEITVKLKHPGGQYSVYEDHGASKNPQ